MTKIIQDKYMDMFMARIDNGLELIQSNYPTRDEIMWHINFKWEREKLGDYTVAIFKIKPKKPSHE